MKVVLEQLRLPMKILEGGWSSHVGMKCRIMQQQHLIGFEGKFQNSEPMGRAAVLYQNSTYASGHTYVRIFFSKFFFLEEYTYYTQ